MSLHCENIEFLSIVFDDKEKAILAENDVVNLNIESFLSKLRIIMEQMGLDLNHISFTVE